MSRTDSIASRPSPSSSSSLGLGCTSASSTSYCAWRNSVGKLGTASAVKGSVAGISSCAAAAAPASSPAELICSEPMSASSCMASACGMTGTSLCSAGASRASGARAGCGGTARSGARPAAGAASCSRGSPASHAARNASGASESPCSESGGGQSGAAARPGFGLAKLSTAGMPSIRPSSSASRVATPACTKETAAGLSSLSSNCTSSASAGSSGSASGLGALLCSSDRSPNLCQCAMRALSLRDSDALSSTSPLTSAMALSSGQSTGPSARAATCCPAACARGPDFPGPSAASRSHGARSTAPTGRDAGMGGQSVGSAALATACADERLVASDAQCFKGSITHKNGRVWCVCAPEATAGHATMRRP
jgi:hypothetical protein